MNLLDINFKSENVLNEFKNAFYKVIKDYYSKNNDALVVLNIGTDKCIGDSLGPLIGYKLKEINLSDVYIYGNLEEPVMATNLKEKIKEIYDRFTNPFVIAIDAALGENVGNIIIKPGGIKPGAGVDKNLPTVGDISITGIVNICCLNKSISLFVTRLSIVMNMADIISDGLKTVLHDIFQDKEQTNEKKGL